MKRTVILLLTILLCIPAFSTQPDDKDKYKRMLVAMATVIDGDTVPSVELAEVVIYGKRIYPSPRKQRKYDKLTRGLTVSHGTYDTSGAYIKSEYCIFRKFLIAHILKIPSYYPYHIFFSDVITVGNSPR